MKKRSVMLFGAGAAQEWNAPSTQFLTESILKTGFRKLDTTTITSLIYERLKESSNSKEINFESILNFVEQLYTYSQLNNQLSSFIITSQEPEDINTGLFDELDTFSEYEIVDFNLTSQTYSLVIPGYYKLKESNIPFKISPYEKYFELLYAELINHIIGHIGKYSCHTEKKDMIFTPNNEAINHLMKQCNSFDNNQIVHRMYSLNYDRLFKIVLEKIGMDIFEGFEVGNTFVDYDDCLAPNIRRITTDFNCNCFYNLHGSAYWQVENNNKDQTNGYQYYLTAGPNTQSTAVIEVENNRRIIASNIITGYQKQQKTLFSPFRQMMAAFEIDCSKAFELYIVGYKFGDEQINDIIRNMRKYNPQSNINLIDPDFDKENEMIKFLMNWHAPENHVNHYDPEKDNYFSHDHKFRIVRTTYRDYLKQLDEFLRESW